LADRIDGHQLLAAQEDPVGLAEEPLLHAIVRAHHDPDRARAYRFTPFVYGPALGAPALGAPSCEAAGGGLAILRALALRVAAVGRDGIRMWSRFRAPQAALADRAPACC
jgi:hypothetical protein